MRAMRSAGHIIVTVATAGFLATAPAAAATKTWTGNGSNSNWSNAANWLGGIAPVAGADLVFDAAAPPSPTKQSPFNDFPLNTTFGSLTFRGLPLVVSGTSIMVIGNITAETSHTLDLPILLSGAFPGDLHRFTVSGFQTLV